MVTYLTISFSLSLCELDPGGIFLGTPVGDYSFWGPSVPSQLRPLITLGPCYTQDSHPVLKGPV